MWSERVCLDSTTNEVYPRPFRVSIRVAPRFYSLTVAEWALLFATRTDDQGTISAFSADRDSTALSASAA